VLPYHSGAIRYFKEIGLWSPEDEAHNKRLLKRQQVLAAAWQEAETLELDDEEFTAAWLAIRERHLLEAGFETMRAAAGVRPGVE